MIDATDVNGVRSYKSVWFAVYHQLHGTVLYCFAWYGKILSSCW